MTYSEVTASGGRPSSFHSISIPPKAILCLMHARKNASNLYTRSHVTTTLCPRCSNKVAVASVRYTKAGKRLSGESKPGPSVGSHNLAVITMIRKAQKLWVPYTEYYPHCSHHLKGRVLQEREHARRWVPRLPWAGRTGSVVISLSTWGLRLDEVGLCTDVQVAWPRASTDVTSSCQHWQYGVNLPKCFKKP